MCLTEPHRGNVDRLATTLRFELQVVLVRLAPLGACGICIIHISTLRQPSPFRPATPPEPGVQGLLAVCAAQGWGEGLKGLSGSLTNSVRQHTSRLGNRWMTSDCGHTSVRE